MLPKQTSIVSCHVNPLPPRQENPYFNTLETVAKVITVFNLDKKVALYGFGAKWKNKEYPSHCFPLSGDKNAPYMRDIEV